MGTIFRDCPGCPNQLNHATESHAGFSLVLLRCCRQIYQEARLIVFSANTWSFTCPVKALVFFDLMVKPKIPIEAKFVIRRLHLDLMVRSDSLEEDWGWFFSEIAENLKSLHHLSISIDQRPSVGWCLKQWQFEEPVESSFLRSLWNSRDLELRTVTITVSDPHILHLGRKIFTAEDGRQYRWTMAQKQEWAEYMRRVLLRQEDPRPAIGGRN